MSDICHDHWHCDPTESAHLCAPDRSQPCPACGATAPFQLRAQGVDWTGPVLRAMAAQNLADARAEAEAACRAAPVGSVVTALATAYPDDHWLAPVARFMRAEDGPRVLGP